MTMLNFLHKGRNIALKTIMILKYLFINNLYLKYIKIYHTVIPAPHYTPFMILVVKSRPFYIVTVVWI